MHPNTLRSRMEKLGIRRGPERVSSRRSGARGVIGGGTLS